MAKTITLKYDGKCRDCGRQLYAGEEAVWFGRGKIRCAGYCTDNEDDGSLAEARRDNHEYAMGKMEAERYMSDKKIYGAELADQWEMEAEMARFNRGEDC